MSLANNMSGWEDTSFHQCRWGFCRLSFLTLDSLERHVEDHLKRSEPVDRDALGVTFRDGWYRGEEKKSTGIGSLPEQLNQRKKPRLSDFAQTTSSNHTDSSALGPTPAAIIVTSTSSFLHSSSRPRPAGSPSTRLQPQPLLQLQSQPQPSNTASDTEASPPRSWPQTRRSVPHKAGDPITKKSSQDASSSSVVPNNPRRSQAHTATERPSTRELIDGGKNRQSDTEIQSKGLDAESQTGSAGGPSYSSTAESRASTSGAGPSSQAGSSTKKSRKKKKSINQSPSGATIEAKKPFTPSTQTLFTAESKDEATANSDDDILDLLVMDTPSPVSRPAALPNVGPNYGVDEDDVQILSSSRSLRSARPIKSTQEGTAPSDQATDLVKGSVDKQKTRGSSSSSEKDIDMVDLTSPPPDSSRPSASTSASIFSFARIQSTEQDVQESQDDPDASLDSDLGTQTQVDVQAVMNFHGIPIPNHLFKIGHDLLDGEEEEDE